MGRSVMERLGRGNLWRVAAMTMMDRQQLSRTLSGPDASDWVFAAAACGIAAAQVRLGRMLLNGEGLPENRRAAYKNFQKAAAQGDVEAHNMLGRCHEHGWGTRVSYFTAALHYRIAAEAGLDWAQYNLGHMLLSGVGVLQNREAAFSWYSRAAAQGHARAMNLIGRCYEEGWGTSKNDNLAVDWYRRSARAGYFRGAYNLASALSEKGCERGAIYWFRRAIGAAPEESRTKMLSILARHDSALVRGLARVPAAERLCRGG